MTIGDVSLPTNIIALSSSRLTKLRTQMVNFGYDTVVLTSPDNVLYATGYESMAATINRNYVYAGIITLEDVLLVAPAADFAPAIEAGLRPDNVYPFGQFFFSGDSTSAHTEVRHATFNEAFTAATRRIGTGRAIAEAAVLPQPSLTAFMQSPGVTTEGAAWMLAVRAEKLPFELELLQYATKLTEQAIEAGINAAAIGVTDRQIASVVASHMALGGALPRNTTVVGGLRSALADALSTERPLRPGDLLRFDVGCSYYGYKSDMARTVVIGEATAMQSTRFNALSGGLHAAFDRMRPGMRAKDVFATTVQTVEDLGLKPFRRQHVGHAIGLAVYENPVITPDSVDILQAGMTFCLETPYYEPGWGGMMIEDTGVLTESGFELFSTSDRTLRVIAT